MALRKQGSELSKYETGLFWGKTKGLSWLSYILSLGVQNEGFLFLLF